MDITVVENDTLCFEIHFSTKCIPSSLSSDVWKLPLTKFWVLGLHSTIWTCSIENDKPTFLINLDKIYEKEDLLNHCHLVSDSNTIGSDMRHI